MVPVACLLVLGLAGAVAGPPFIPSAAVCSGVHTLQVGLLNGKREAGSTQVVDVENMIGASANHKWANLNDQYFGCTDGRPRAGLLSTPGGDLGEFIRALTVMSSKAGKVYTFEETKQHLADFLKNNPNKRFAMCSDQKAMGALIEATGVAEADFDITRPPASFATTKAPFEFLLKPKFQGDPTIVAMLTTPKAMFVPDEIVKNAIKAFFTLMWDKSNSVSKQMHLVVADGMHVETAAVMLTTSEVCVKEAVNPVIQPNKAGKSIFTYHASASDVLRDMMIQSFMKGDKAGLKSVVQANARAAMSRIALQNMLTVISKTRPGVPVYEASLTSA